VAAQADRVSLAAADSEFDSVDENEEPPAQRCAAARNLKHLPPCCPLAFSAPCFGINRTYLRLLQDARTASVCQYVCTAAGDLLLSAKLTFQHVLQAADGGRNGAAAARLSARAAQGGAGQKAAGAHRLLLRLH